MEESRTSFDWILKSHSIDWATRPLAAFDTCPSGSRSAPRPARASSLIRPEPWRTASYSLQEAGADPISSQGYKARAARSGESNADQPPGLSWVTVEKVREYIDVVRYR